MGSAECFARLNQITSQNMANPPDDLFPACASSIGYGEEYNNWRTFEEGAGVHVLTALEVFGPSGVQYNDMYQG